MNLCKAKLLPKAASWTAGNDSAAYLQVLLKVTQRSTSLPVSPEGKNWLNSTAIPGCDRTPVTDILQIKADTAVSGNENHKGAQKIRGL